MESHCVNILKLLLLRQHELVCHIRYYMYFVSLDLILEYLRMRYFDGHSIRNYESTDNESVGLQ